MIYEKYDGLPGEGITYNSSQNLTTVYMIEHIIYVNIFSKENTTHSREQSHLNQPQTFAPFFSGC